MPFRALDKLINLKDGYRRRFKMDSLDLILAQEDGQVFLFASICPHQEQSLETGDIADGVIFCPRHQYGFDLTTGENLQDLCGKLATFPVVYEGNMIGFIQPAAA